MMSLIDEVNLKYAYSIDIHGMSVNEAKRFLERTIISLDRKIRDVIIIHGYNSGNALQFMVRNELHCKRIKEKIIPLNPGRTILRINSYC
ncbi:MAG: Smr/MutS family protein [Saccharofermentanales bacterium]